MKICILTHTFPKELNDSNAPFMHALITGLKKNGHDVSVLTPFTPGFKREEFPYKINLYKYIWPDFFHILGYSQTLKNGSTLKFSTYVLFPFFFTFGILALINLSRKEKFDVISSHWILPNGFFAYVTSRILKIPYVISLPGSDVYLAKKNKIFSTIAKISANGATSMTSDSPRFLKEILSLGIKNKKTQIIPYPVILNKEKVSTKDLNIIRKDLNLKRGIVILAVGRLVYKKGFEYLVKAMSLLLKKHKNIKLIIIGDGDLKEKLQKLIVKLNLADDVKLIGNINRDRIYKYYNLCDIFVTTSIRDKNGNIDDQPVSLIEGMSCGKPVVATDFPGISLTVKHQVNGFLFPEKNITLLAKSLEKLIISKSLRSRMGKESRRIVRNELTDEKIAKKYVSFLSKTLSSVKNTNSKA